VTVGSKKPRRTLEQQFHSPDAFLDTKPIVPKHGKQAATYTCNVN